MRYRDALKKIEELGAHQKDLEIAKRFRGWSEFAEKHPVDMAILVLSQMPEDLPSEVLDACAKTSPRTAIVDAAYYLTKDLLNECARREPLAALHNIPELLDQAVLDECARAKPAAALICAARLLTPDCLDWCAEQEPWAALEYANHHLSPSRLDACAVAEPGYALLYARRLLTQKRKKWCENKIRELQKKVVLK